MSTHPYTLLDVFSSEPLAGNALAVVHDADGVPEAVQAAFAKETRLAETSFVQSPSNPRASYRNRIWTVAEELAFAGHPTLGVAVAQALSEGEDDAIYTQETRAGTQQVVVSRSGFKAYASMVQIEAEFLSEVEPKTIFPAIGLKITDGNPRLRPQLVSTGLPTLVVAVSSKAALDRAVPDRQAIAAIFGHSFNVYAVVFDSGANVAYARCFPSTEVEDEDPATGSAAGTLMAYLHKYTGADRLTIHQGEHVGRPSIIRANMDSGRVRVGGDVVVIATGTVHLPDA